MKDNASFDEQVKQQLGDYQPSVPPHIWENIAKDRRRKRPAGWIFFRDKRLNLLWAILVITGAGLLVNDVHNSNTQNIPLVRYNSATGAGPGLQPAGEKASTEYVQPEPVAALR